MNRLDRLFQNKKKDILNIYFTAGYPQLGDTVKTIKALANSGVDLLEVGIPYSDPLADGQTIQDSSQQALKNGTSLKKAISQIKEAREQVDIPMVVMGYYNQFLQFGIDNFIAELKAAQVDGVIIPDLPLDYFKKHYQSKFEAADIKISFLITPETSPIRIKEADQLSTGFVYIVAQSSITGGKKDISQAQKEYFEKIKSMHLQSPTLIGFGIHNKETFETACQYANGAIIGSAFIRHLAKDGTSRIARFVEEVRP